MFKFLIIAAALILSNAQLLFPPVTLPPTQDAFSVNDILGNYFVAGIYSNQPLTFLPDQKTPKCMIMSLTIDSSNVVTMKTVFVDPSTNQEQATTDLYVSVPGDANELVSQKDVIFNIKYYNGENDFIVKYHGANDGKVIIQKRDGSVAYVLSRNGVSSGDLAAIQGKADNLGVKDIKFTAIDNTHC